MTEPTLVSQPASRHNPFAPSLAVDVLDSLPAQIAVLDSRGLIVSVNETWKRFGRDNGCQNESYYVGQNYLAVTEAALQRAKSPDIEAVVSGLRLVLAGEQLVASVEYPCQSPTELRWFVMRASPFERNGAVYLVVSHQDITERKLAEEAQAAAEQSLRQSQASLQPILTNSPDALYALDLDTLKPNFLNRAEFCGYSKEELEVTNSIFNALHPEDAAFVKAHFDKLARSELAPADLIEYRLRHKAGHWEWIQQRHAILAQRPDGLPREILFTLTVITAHKEAEQALKASEEKWRTLFAILPVGVSIIDKDRNLLDMNTALERVLQISRDGLAQGLYRQRQYLRSDNTSIAPDDFPTVQAINEHRIIQDFEMCVIKENGDRIWTNVNVAPLPFPADQAVVVTADINQRKQAEVALQQAKQDLEAANSELERALQREKTLARTDSLTGLNNRRHFFDLANHAFAVAQRYHQPLSIILFDIDHFKLVNDRYGRLVGDHVLEQVAVTLRRNLRRADELARYGGEEFIVLLPNTGGRPASAVARYLRERVVAHQVITESGPVHVTLSGGLAELFKPDDSLDQIIQRADQALYAAKEAGRNRTHLFEPATRPD